MVPPDIEEARTTGSARWSLRLRASDALLCPCRPSTIGRNGTMLRTLPDVEHGALASSQGHAWPRRAARRSRSTPMTIRRMDNVLIVVDDLEAAWGSLPELGRGLGGP